MPKKQAAPATLAGVVFRGRTLYGESDPEWMVSILEAPRSFGAREGDDGRARKEIWPLLIQGWTFDDKRNPSDPAYNFMNDVERQLDRIIAVNDSPNGAGFGGSKPKYPEDYLLGLDEDGESPLIVKFTMSPGTVRPPVKDLSSKSFFYLPVQIELARISR